MNAEIETEVRHHEEAEHHHRHESKITIYVNKKPVKELHHEVTGAEIKAAAILQHVEIQPDFPLFAEKKGHPLELVGDHQKVHIHEHEHFRAVAPDDNS